MSTAIEIAAEGLVDDEGFRLHAYPDVESPLFKSAPRMPWGFESASRIFERLPHYFERFDGSPWTIGMGLTVYADGTRVEPGDILARSEAHAQMIRHLEGCDQRLSVALNPERAAVMNPKMRAAILRLIYNTGQVPPTLVRYVNAGLWNEAQAEFKHWNKSRGEVKQYLVDRRKRDEELFAQGIDEAIAFAEAYQARKDDVV